LECTLENLQATPAATVPSVAEGVEEKYGARKRIREAILRDMGSLRSS
jgi:hypothetical protein